MMGNYQIRKDFSEEEINFCEILNSFYSEAKNLGQYCVKRMKELNDGCDFVVDMRSLPGCYAKLADISLSFSVITGGEWNDILCYSSFEDFISKSLSYLENPLGVAIDELKKEAALLNSFELVEYLERAETFYNLLHNILSKKSREIEIKKVEPITTKKKEEVKVEKLSIIVTFVEFKGKDRKILETLDLKQEGFHEDLSTIILDVEAEDIDALDSKNRNKVIDRFRKRIERLNERLNPLVFIDRDGEDVFWKRL